MSDAIFSETRTDGAASPAARLGAELRTARQNLGWELADLARSLRIRQAYLEAIEAGRMSDLPGTTYALGFVRAYATALGLKGEQVASRFRAEAGEANMRPALSFPAPVPQRGVPAGALMLLGLVVLAGAYSGWYYVSEHQRTPAETVPPIPDQLLAPTQPKPTPSPQVASILPNAAAPAPDHSQPPQPVPAPAQTAPATPGAAPTGTAILPSVQAPGTPAPMVQMPPPTGAATPPATAATATPAVAVPPGTRIVLKATGDAWVTVKQKVGPALYSKLMHAGDTWAVPADRTDLTLTTGNAGGTEIDVDGTAVTGLGPTGLVRHNVPLDPTLLKSGNFTQPAATAKPKTTTAADGNT
jgi:cytoskeleton protein RodZ